MTLSEDFSGPQYSVVIAREYVLHRRFPSFIIIGIIPEEDHEDLLGLVIAKIFGPRARMEDTIKYVREHGPERY